MKVKYYTNIQDNLHFLIFDTFNKAYDWGLHPTDIKVLAELYNMDYFLLQDIKSYKDRMTVLFSKESKAAIFAKLKISYNTFNNSLTRLRKKDIIEDNSLEEKYLFDLTKQEFEITLNVLNERGSREVVTTAQ